MTSFSFYLRKKITPRVIEKVCSEMNLTLTMKGSLKSLAENMHWHYKKGEDKGVLEITLMLKTNEIVLSCKKNRNADWIKDAMDELKSKLR